LNTPAIVINFKTYNEVVGERGLDLAKLCSDIASETGAHIGIAPQMVDLAHISKAVSIPVFAQHIDAHGPGANTGFTSPEAVAGAGAYGSLINHSEHRLKIADIDEIVNKCKELNLTSIVCTNNLKVSCACAYFEPEFIAIEPPELIGGDISVTSADPGIVENTVLEIKKISSTVKVLTGAGVKTGTDVSKAIELGTDGVLLASGVVKAKDPKQVLRDLISGL
jgi:triosephosphate isomerase